MACFEWPPRAYAEHLLLRLQFMIEANLMVRRGELTIAEAEHILDSEIRTPSYASISSIATKDGRLLSSDELIQERDATRRENQREAEPRRKELGEFLAGWRNKFVAFNNGGPPVLLSARRKPGKMHR